MGIINAAIVRPVGGLVNAQLNSMAASAGRVAGLARALTVPPPASPHTGPQDPKARFEMQARARGYASKAGYERLQRQLWRVWARYIVAATLLLALGVIGGVHGIWILAIIPAPLACLILAIRPAFWQFQLRSKSALPFSAFVCSPGEWFPIPEPLSVAGATKCLGILAVLSLLPASAWAQTAIGSSSSNLALNMLNALIPISTGNSLTAMIAIMTSSLMFAGVGMLSYHILVGLVATAHDGVPTLGMHQVWSPIQFCVGFAMLAPLPGRQGLDGMQVLVYQVAKLGSSTADSMWSSFVDNSLPNAASSDSQNMGYITSDMLSALTITRQVADLELCSAVHTLEGDTVDAPPPAVDGVTGTDSIVWDYGSCGSMTMPLASPAPAEAANTSAAEMQAMQAATTNYQNSRHAALTALVTSLRADTTLVEAGKGSVPNNGTWPATISAAVTSLSGYATTYDTAMQKAATAYLSTRDADVYSALKTDASNLGWMSAGSYWRTLAQVGDNLSQLQSASPDFGNFDGDNYADVSLSSDADAARAVKHFDLAWAQATAKTRLTAADLSAGGNRSGSTLDRIIGPMWNPLATSLVNLGSVNTNDSESTFITLGHNLSLAGSIGITAGTIVSAATGNIAGKWLGAGSAWDWLSGFAKMPIEMCMILGVFLSYVLPMLPWIAVLWLMVGWATLILEALIAAPLYALLFIRCDGKELVGGTQTPGFVILFNLWLYPALGMAGLGAAFVALPALSNFLVSQFADSFIGQSGGHIVGLFGILMGIGMLVWLQFMLTLKTLELVHILPERIPRWFGSMLGGAADGVSETSNRMYAAVSSTSSKAIIPASKTMARKPSVGGRPGGGSGGGNGVTGEGGGNAVAGSDQDGSGGQGGVGGSVAPRGAGGAYEGEGFDGGE